MGRISHHSINYLWNLEYLCQQALTVVQKIIFYAWDIRLSQFNINCLWYLIYINRLSLYKMNYDTCVNSLTIHYNLWYLISVNRLSQYSMIMISGIFVSTGSLSTTWRLSLWYLSAGSHNTVYIIIDIWNLLTGTHSTADSSTHRNGHGPDSTVSVDETTTDSGIHAPGFAPEMSQVDENSQGEEEGKWWYL